MSKERKKIVENMYNNKISIEDIVRMTGISLDEVEKIIGYKKNCKEYYDDTLFNLFLFFLFDKIVL